MVTRGVDCSGP